MQLIKTYQKDTVSTQQIHFGFPMTNLTNLSLLNHTFIRYNLKIRIIRQISGQKTAR